VGKPADFRIGDHRRDIFGHPAQKACKRRRRIPNLAQGQCGRALKGRSRAVLEKGE
jgi:hypothetical protein